MVGVVEVVKILQEPQLHEIIAPVELNGSAVGIQYMQIHL
jgi:hypothetical protein